MGAALKADDKLEDDKPEGHNDQGSGDNDIESGFAAANAKDAFVEEKRANFGESEAGDCEKIKNQLRLNRVSRHANFAVAGHSGLPLLSAPALPSFPLL